METLLITTNTNGVYLWVLDNPQTFLSAAIIIRYPNPLSLRLNNEAIIYKEYLSMTKYLVFEVGFSEKRNKL